MKGGWMNRACWGYSQRWVRWANLSLPMAFTGSLGPIIPCRPVIFNKCPISEYASLVAEHGIVNWSMSRPRAYRVCPTPQVFHIGILFPCQSHVSMMTRSIGVIEDGQRPPAVALGIVQSGGRKAWMEDLAVELITRPTVNLTWNRHKCRHLIQPHSWWIMEDR